MLPPTHVMAPLAQNKRPRLFFHIFINVWVCTLINYLNIFVQELSLKNIVLKYTRIYKLRLFHKNKFVVTY